jgi:hypothetical protein
LDSTYTTTIEGPPLRFTVKTQGFKKHPHLEDISRSLRDSIWKVTTKCGPPAYKAKDKDNEM